MVSKKKLAFFSFIRSEYGSLSFLLHELKKCNMFWYELVVGGAHLVPEYGLTIREIEAEGMPISAKIDFLSNNTASESIGFGLGVVYDEVNKFLTASNPDLVFLLGDRIELLPIATQALLHRIPIAHISGGEITEGAIDNQIRHALSKMANIHFVGTENAKSNLINMGECADIIYVTGELGLDVIDHISYKSKTVFCTELGINMDREILVVTFHPETVTNQITVLFLKELFYEILRRKPGYEIVATASNFDSGGAEINRLLKQLGEENDQFHFIESLGKVRYYNLLKHASVVMGNSSSGIYEVQSFNLPVINIGDRQKGRYSNPNVYNVPVDVSNILDALEYVCSDDFTSKFINSPNVYRKGNAAVNIVNVLNSVDWGDLYQKKDCLN